LGRPKRPLRRMNGCIKGYPAQASEQMRIRHKFAGVGVT
jgi:hypothetical protein